MLFSFISVSQARHDLESRSLSFSILFRKYLPSSSTPFNESPFCKWSQTTSISWGETFSLLPVVELIMGPNLFPLRRYITISDLWLSFKITPLVISLKSVEYSTQGGSSRNQWWPNLSSLYTSWISVSIIPSPISRKVLEKSNNTINYRILSTSSCTRLGVAPKLVCCVGDRCGMSWLSRGRVVCGFSPNLRLDNQ